MKMTYIHITILACFLIKTLNWQVLWGKEKYSLDNLYEKLKKQGFFQINVTSKICLLQGRIYGINF